MRRVNEGESLLDVSLSCYGSVAGAFELAKANGVSMDAEVGGMELEIPEAETDRSVKGYFAGLAWQPATGISGADMGGIGAMGIEVDFSVN